MVERGPGGEASSLPRILPFRRPVIRALYIWWQPGVFVSLGLPKLLRGKEEYFIEIGLPAS